MGAEETYRVALRMEVCDSAKSVAAVSAEIAALQQKEERMVHTEPIGLYSEME